MQDLTTGSVSRHLLKTTSFMLVTMVFQTLYFLVDLYWVGRLGTAAVAAVGIAGSCTRFTDDLEDFKRHVRKAGDEISAKLGHRA